MSNSDILEELLYEIHQNNVFDEVIKLVKEIRGKNPYIQNLDAYEIAYQLVKEKDKKN